MNEVARAIGQSVYLSSQGFSDWPTLDECLHAGETAAREVAQALEGVLETILDQHQPIRLNGLRRLCMCGCPTFDAPGFHREHVANLIREAIHSKERVGGAA